MLIKLADRKCKIVRDGEVRTRAQKNQVKEICVPAQERPTRAFSINERVRHYMRRLTIDNVKQWCGIGFTNSRYRRVRRR